MGVPKNIIEDNIRSTKKLPFFEPGELAHPLIWMQDDGSLIIQEESGTGSAQKKVGGAIGFSLKTHNGTTIQTDSEASLLVQDELSIYPFSNRQGTGQHNSIFLLFVEEGNMQGAILKQGLRIDGQRGLIRDLISDILGLERKVVQLLRISKIQIKQDSILLL